MSYYENRIKALEEKVAEMAKRERMKAIPVEAQLIDTIARLKAEVERLRKAANNYIDVCDRYAMFRSEDKRLMARVASIELRDAAKEGKPSA